VIDKILLEVLRNRIVGIVRHHHVIGWQQLFDQLHDEFPDAVGETLQQAISETIQANRIKRIEYFIPDHASRHEFYMPHDFRLMA
jgi:hypothetical protein